MKLPTLPINVTLRNKQAEPLSTWESLTPRQRQVADLLVKGYTHTRISKILGISKATVIKHVMEVKEKLRLIGPAAKEIVGQNEGKAKDDG